jgi:PRC-barrel domain
LPVSSSGHGGQLEDWILAQWRHCFQGHVAGALYGPFIVLFDQDGWFADRDRLTDRRADVRSRYPQSAEECKMIKKSMVLASAAIIGIAVLSGGAGAQGTPQTIELVKVDVQKLAAGYRASKVIGSSVVNDANETIGTIDDLLVSHDGKQPYAVLSIGGFLGMGTRLVVVPYDLLKFADKRVTLPGGTKEGLKMLPEFKYATG